MKRATALMLVTTWACSRAVTPYVVYVADLGLRDMPTIQVDAVATLKEGARVTPLANVVEEQGTRWRQVKVGDEVGWVAARYIVPAPDYDAAARAGKLDTIGDKYLVYVEETNLRAGPEADSPVLAVLAAGTVVANRSSRLYDVGRGRLDYSFRRQVCVGDKVGWLADRDVIPARIFEVYSDAHELGKNGDGTAMVAALKSLYDRAEELRPNPETPPDNLPYSVNPSPDNRKVFVATNVGRDLVDEYGEGFIAPMWDIDATLYFVAGRGLVEYRASTECESWAGGYWAPDSRYYADERGVIDLYLGLFRFVLRDTDTGEERKLGLISYMEGQGSVEFSNGWLLWLDEQSVAGAVGLVPALVAYNLAGGERIRILKGDVETVPKEPASDAVYYSLYDVILVPDEPCPASLRESQLYKRWNGAHAFVLDSEY
jgi:hypothetical protein